MASKNYHVLLLADSRTVSLQQLLENQLTLPNTENVIIEVIAIKGAKIETLTHYATTNLTTSQYDLIYLLAGVNNLSVKHNSGKLSPVFLDTPNLVEVMFEKFVHAKQILQEYGTKVVICQMVGLKFERYHNSYPFPNSQLAIDEGIPILNHSINILNHESMVKSPYLMSTVHALKKHRRVAMYGFLNDGIHLNTNLLNTWAKLIVKSLEPNLRHLLRSKAP